jgi:hypothetical protein
MEYRNNQGAAPDAYNAYLYGKYRCVMEVFGFVAEILNVLCLYSIFFFDNLCNCAKNAFSNWIKLLDGFFFAFHQFPVETLCKP